MEVMESALNYQLFTELESRPVFDGQGLFEILIGYIVISILGAYQKRFIHRSRVLEGGH
jgi:hypothetical protein